MDFHWKMVFRVPPTLQVISVRKPIWCVLNAFIAVENSALGASFLFLLLLLLLIPPFLLLLLLLLLLFLSIPPRLLFRRLGWRMCFDRNKYEHGFISFHFIPFHFIPYYFISFHFYVTLLGCSGRDLLPATGRFNWRFLPLLLLLLVPLLLLGLFYERLNGR